MADKVETAEESKEIGFLPFSALHAQKSEHRSM
jgi:hypothetical protein